jgi:carbon storage regulator
MLVLTRKTGEAIIIRDDVRVTVSAIRGNRVRIGVEAPLSTPIHRAEVAQAIQQAANERRRFETVPA